MTVDVTKKAKEDYGHPPREGAYLHGLFMEGRPLRSTGKAPPLRKDLVSAFTRTGIYLIFCFLKIQMPRWDPT